MASNLKRGDPLDADFRPIDTKRDSTLTLGMTAAKIHTNTAIKCQSVYYFFIIFYMNIYKVWSI